MYLLVIEDDYLQANWIQESLQTAFPTARIQRIGTESDFRSHLDEIAKHRPTVIIMDVMLRWTDPSPDMTPPPEDVREGKFYRAGVRCKELLAERDETKDIPVILYTVLEASDLHKELQDSSATIVHVPKESDPWPLVEKIKDFSGRRP